MKVLEKEPEDRFLSAAEMQQALRQCAKDLATTSPAHQTVPSPQLASRNFPPGASGQGQFHPPGYGHR